MGNKQLIVVKDGVVHISDVVNDCVSLCVPTYKNEPLSSILQKLCSRIDQCCGASSGGGGQVFIEEGDNITITGSGTQNDPYVINSGGGGENFFILDTQTVDLEGNGSAGLPLFANVNVHPSPTNAIVVTPQGLIVQNTVESGVVYGGIVTWLQDYDYHVSPAGYWIDFQFYESPAADFTLSPPDGTFNRIDTFVLTTNGTAEVLEGTPSASPTEPPLDPAEELRISAAIVETGTTEPSITGECIYRNNLEWTPTSSNLVRINPDSVTNPCNGVKAIEGTGVVDNDNILFERGSSFFPTTIASQLDLFIRSKASFATNGLIIQWELGGVPVGDPVLLEHLAYFFDSTITADCQLVAIPLFHFNIDNNSEVDSIRITGEVVAGSLGFYIDDLCIQGQPLPEFPDHTDTDELAKVSSDDTTAGYLEDKIVAGSNITITVLNDGLNESLEISAAATAALTFDNGLTRTLDNTQLGGTLLHDTVVGNGAFQFDFTGSHANYVFGVNNNTAGTAGDFSSDGGTAVLGSGVNGGIFNGTAIGVQGYSLLDGGPAGLFGGTYTANNTTETIVTVQRIASGAALAGLGADIQYDLENSTGGTTSAGSLAMSWVSPTTTSESSRFSLSLINAGVSARKLALENTGQLILDEYGGGTFVGTDTFWLAVDVNGNVIEMPAPITFTGITADNGLTENVANNVQLGGTLLQNTTINVDTFFLRLTGDGTGSDAVLDVVNTTVGPSQPAITGTSVQGNAIVGNSISGAGVYGFSDSGNGVFAESPNGNGITATTSGGTAIQGIANFSSDDDVITVIGINRATSGTADAGIGAAIDFEIQTSISGDIANRIVSIWDDAVHATRTSTFTISGVGNTVTQDLLTLNGDGSAQLDQYGSGSFSGSPTFALAVDASGNIIETALAGGTSITADNGLTENVPNNVQLGGSLIQNTTITSAVAANRLTITGVNTFAEGALLDVITSGNIGTAVRAETTNGRGVEASETGNGIAIIGLSTGGGVAVFADAISAGVGLHSQAIDGLAGEFIVQPASTNTVVPVVSISRATSGSATNGIGQSLDFYVNSTTALQLSNQLISKFTTATNGIRTSQFIVTGVESAVTQDLLTLNGNGSVQLNQYGAGTITGTPTFMLATDTNGNVIEEALPLTSLTADNGLTENVANNIQLGGTLLQNTTINTTASFKLIVTGSEPTTTTGSITAINTSATGHAIHATADSTNTSAIYGTSATSIGVNGAGNTGVQGSTTSGTGVWGIATSGLGLLASTVSGTNAAVIRSDPSSTNTVVEVLSVERTTSGAAANGIGVAIGLKAEVDNLTTQLSNQIISKWTTAATATRTSQLVITGVNSGTTADKLTLSGNGALRLHGYGGGTITAGAATFALNVDANGNVIEAAIGSGMTNPMSAEGDIIISDDGAGTPKRLAAGTNGFVLTSNGPGTEPSWQAAGGAAGITRSVNTTASPLTMGSAALTDYVYFVTGTTTVTLPTAVGNTNLYTVSRLDSTLVTTIATTGGQTIDGNATYQLLDQYETVTMVSTNSQWVIVG